MVVLESFSQPVKALLVLAKPETKGPPNLREHKLAKRQR
jgi:hypothetical protein